MSQHFHAAPLMNVTCISLTLRSDTLKITEADLCSVRTFHPTWHAALPCDSSVSTAVCVCVCECMCVINYENAQLKGTSLYKIICAHVSMLKGQL